MYVVDNVSFGTAAYKIISYPVEAGGELGAGRDEMVNLTRGT